MIAKIKKMAMFFVCFLFFINIVLPYILRKFYLKKDIITLKNKYINTEKNANHYLIRDVHGTIFMFENSYIFDTKMEDNWNKMNNNDQIKIEYYDLPVDIIDFYPKIIKFEIL
jgi:hypothetical protein